MIHLTCRTLCVQLYQPSGLLLPPPLGEANTIAHASQRIKVRGTAGSLNQEKPCKFRMPSSADTMEETG